MSFIRGSTRRLVGRLGAVALILSAVAATGETAQAGWGRWRRAQRSATPSGTVSYRSPTSYRPPVPSAYPYRYDRFYRGNSFGNGPVPGNFGNYNPSYGIGPGYFASPPGPYAPW